MILVYMLSNRMPNTLKIINYYSSLKAMVIRRLIYFVSLCLEVNINLN